MAFSHGIQSWHSATIKIWLKFKKNFKYQEADFLERLPIELPTSFSVSVMNYSRGFPRSRNIENVRQHVRQRCGCRVANDLTRIDRIAAYLVTTTTLAY